jgi:hypothetical protein
MPDSDADGTAILTLGTLAGGGSSSPPDAAHPGLTWPDDGASRGLSEDTPRTEVKPEAAE